MKENLKIDSKFLFDKKIAERNEKLKFYWFSFVSPT